MAKIIGNTTATPTPRPDWNQTDETKADYIKNKPTIINKFSEDESGNLLYNGDSIGDLDVEYAEQIEANTEARHTHNDNLEVLDNLGENAEGELTYKGQDVGAPKPKILSAIVDGYEEGVPTAIIHAGFYPVSIGIDVDGFPTNARVKRIEIPDVVNETDEYIILEDMATKDAENGFSSPYFIMYPKNAEGIYASSLVALVVFPLEMTNAFYDAATANLFSGKEIKIYYEIEE